MTNDPFGLRSLDLETLRRKRCTKWAAAGDGYAAWIADMDFPVAPAVRDALRAVIDGDEFGYPDWGGVEVLSPAAKLSHSAWPSATDGSRRSTACTIWQT